MVAICNSSGAYIYNCSEKAADNRIEKTNESIYARGGMDYDENGNHRMEDGMCGCLFIVPELIDILSQIGVEAVYFKKEKDYVKYEKEQLKKVDYIFKNFLKGRRMYENNCIVGC